MKIQVTIEATSIKEYAEAVKALAAGYTVAPNPIMAEVSFDVKSAKVATNTYAEAKQAVESDIVKVAEEKPKRTRKAVEKPVDAPKEEKKAATPKAEEKTESEPSDTSEQSGKCIPDFISVKLRAKQIANLPDGKSDVKFILEKLGATKLSDLKEDQYATFMEMSEGLESKPTDSKNVSDVSEESEPAEEEKSDDSGETKPVTLEMIRSKAKEMSVAGYKEEIKAALKEIGAAALTKVPKDKYTEFYEKLGNL